MSIIDKYFLFVFKYRFLLNKLNCMKKSINKSHKKKSTKSYLFKYDKHKNLYHYVERDSKNNLVNYYNFNYKNNALVKYNNTEKIKIFNQFESPCKLIHRFEAGISWIKPVTVDSVEKSITYPKVKKQFAVNLENQVVTFSVSEQIVSQWQ